MTEKEETKKNKIKKEAEALKRDVTQKTIGYITAGFGLVAGLAWNDAIKSSIEIIFPAQENTVVAKFGYALIFTVVLVFITIQLNKLINRDK